MAYDVGQEVSAQWQEDEQWYNAKVLSVERDDLGEGPVDIYLVVFTEYGNEQECTVEMMRPIDGEEGDVAAATATDGDDAFGVGEYSFNDPDEEARRAEEEEEAAAAAAAAAAAEEEEEEERRQAAAAEEARKKKAVDDAAKKKADEAAKQRASAAAAAAEEAARKKDADEKKRKADDEARSKKEAAEAAAKRTAERRKREEEDAAARRAAEETDETELQEVLAVAAARSSTARGAVGGQSRREAAAARRKQGKSKAAAQGYDDDESVLHGVDNIDDVVENAECELFAALDKQEKARSGGDLVALAATLSELAVLPCTPEADALSLWERCLAAAKQAEAGEGGSGTAVLTQCAHVALRRALYLAGRNEPEEAQEVFEQAASRYRRVFEKAPVRAVLRYIVVALARAPGIDLNHFLGLADNGYSFALLRSREEAAVTARIEHHQRKLSSLLRAGQPLERAHCFGIFRATVLGMAIAVADDLPDDQASLLLTAWEAASRLGKADEAVLLGVYILKLNDDAAGLDVLLDAVDNVREYAVQQSLAKLAGSVADATDDELREMAQAEVDDMLTTMSEYDPAEVLRSMRDMQSDMLRVEFRAAAGKPVEALALEEVDLDDLFDVTRGRSDVSLLCAARTYAGLLVAADAGAAKAAVAALSEEFDGPRMLAFLCVAENADVARVAADALCVYAECVKRKADVASTGVIEAAVHLLQHPTLSVIARAACSLKALAGDAACAAIMVQLQKQLAPALLDQLFCSDAVLVKTAAGLCVKLFSLVDEAGAAALASSMIPDVMPDDLADIVDALKRELPVVAAPAARKPPAKPPTESGRKSPALPSKKPSKGDDDEPAALVMVPEPRSSGRDKAKPTPPGKTLPSPAAAPPPAVVAVPAPVVVAAKKQEEARGRGFTQKLEQKFAATDFGASSGSLGTLGGVASPRSTEEAATENTDGDGDGDSGLLLDPDVMTELERELQGTTSLDEAQLSEQSQIEAHELEEQGEDPRVVALLKLGAALEERVNERLDAGEVDEAEDLVDQAVAKYQMLLKLNATSHVGLRRMADALLRKAEFREGPEADELYKRAIDLYDADIEAHDMEESYCHKVQAMIDRAKNKAAEEEPKGSFNVTRKLLAEAKQAAAHVKEREEYINTINEVLTYCRLQTDAKRGAAASSARPAAATATPAAVATAKKSPNTSVRSSLDYEDTQDLSGARGSGAVAAPAKKEAAKPPAATAVAAAAAAKTAAATPKAAAKATNPNAIVRQGSMLVAQKKASTSTTSQPSQKKPTQQGERERLEAALAAKRPVSKVGKLLKEGGGKSLLGRKTWKERLFELNESSLEYYEKSNQTEKPLGAISLFEVTTARAVNIPGKQYCFEVVTEARRFPIQAQSEQDKEEWVRAINSNVDRQKLAKKIKGLGK